METPCEAPLHGVSCQQPYGKKKILMKLCRSNVHHTRTTALSTASPPSAAAADTARVQGCGAVDWLVQQPATSSQCAQCAQQSSASGRERRDLAAPLAQGQDRATPPSHGEAPGATLFTDTGER